MAYARRSIFCERFFQAYPNEQPDNLTTQQPNNLPTWQSSKTTIK